MIDSDSASAALTLTDAEQRLVDAYLSALETGPDDLIGSDPVLVAEFRALMFGSDR